MSCGIFAKQKCKSLMCKHINKNLIKFLLTKTNNLSKKIDDLNTNDTIINFELNDDLQIKLRMLKYKINKDDYYILTTLIDKNKYSIDCLKNLYKKRWNIETDFRYSKYNLSMENITSESNKIFIFIILY